MELKLSSGIAHYQAYGEGIPLLTINGMSGDHHEMMGLFEPLFEDRTGWQRIHLDLPGHGKTTVDETVNSYDRVLDFILEFAETLLDDRSFMVAGQSLGCHFALGVIHQRPEKIKGGCLISCNIEMLGKYPQKDLNHVVLEENPDFLAGLDPEYEWLKDYIVAQSKSGLDNLYKIWLSKGLKLWDQQYWDRIRENSPDTGFSFKATDLKQPFGKPVLILAGRQDSFTGYEISWEVFEMYPRATLVILDKAGHLVGLAEQERLTQTLITEWLDRVEADIQ